jgi:hypothetical protein
MGVWKGDPIHAKQRKDCQVNEEEPMLPVILEDVTPDVAGSVTASKDKKTVTDDDEDKLMPILL